MAFSTSCALSFLLVVVATGLVAAGIVTDFWTDNGPDDHQGLFHGVQLENFGINTPDEEWLLAVRLCTLVALAVSLVVLVMYSCVCCCEETHTTCLVCTQFLLLQLAVAASGGAVIVQVWQNDWSGAIFGWSYYLTAAGAVVYLVALLAVLAELCCGSNKE